MAQMQVLDVENLLLIAGMRRISSNVTRKGFPSQIQVL